ncbi:S1C family serine protease [Halobaculum sp. D14]|uniref:S1C family serine protease n=1 Tax=Halobaculum sp. D14 TaxID=3421642 RepID=UPI003EB7F9AE
MPSRREFLAAVGAAGAAGAAGCVRIGGRTGSGAPVSGADVDDSATAAVYDRVVPSVVGVRVYDDSGPLANGSGFVTDDGVVTNQHVVAGASRVKLRFHGNVWRDADVVGTDAYSDLAVLSPADRPASATPLGWVDTSPEPPVGTDVLAIGTPYGYDGSASSGVISGVDRLLPGPNDFQIADAVQTDAALNPGNSGGPLVTMAGSVAGVVNSAGGENIGFAISAALAKRVVPALAADGDYDHSYMGVRLLEVSPTVAAAYGLDDVGGVVVTQVAADGPSAGVLRGSDGTDVVDGVRVPTGGDVIVGMAGRDVETQADLSNVLALRTSPGETIPVRVRRGDAATTVDLTLGARPEP